MWFKCDALAEKLNLVCVNLLMSFINHEHAG